MVETCDSFAVLAFFGFSASTSVVLKATCRVAARYFRTAAFSDFDAFARYFEVGSSMIGVKTSITNCIGSSPSAASVFFSRGFGSSTSMTFASGSAFGSVLDSVDFFSGGAGGTVGFGASDGGAPSEGADGGGGVTLNLNPPVY